jgi:type II secretory pathway pseudopilin PulG
MRAKNIYRSKDSVTFWWRPSKQSGFTLIEAMVAIGVLLVTLVAFVSFADISIRAFATARERYLAAKIAQEGMELITNKRDNNILCLKSGTCTLRCRLNQSDWRLDLARRAGNSCIFGNQAIQWQIDATLPNQLLPNNNAGGNDLTATTLNTVPPICLGTGVHAGKFKHCATGETPIKGSYRRVIEVRSGWSSAALEVRSIVEWTSRNGPQSLTLQQILFGLPGSGSSGGGGGQISTEGLVAHWTFDEGGGTTAFDSSGNNNNGTLSHTAGAVPLPPYPQWSTGILDEALDFDGSTNYVAMSDTNDSLDVRNISVSMWIFKQSPTNTYSSLVWRQYGTGCGDLWGFAYDNNASGNYMWGVGPGPVGSPLVPAGLIGGPSSGDVGKWVHLVGTYDADAQQMRLYKNGVLDSSSVVPPNNDLPAETTPVTIGAQDDGDCSNSGAGGKNMVLFSDVVIDEVRIYDRAITQNEVSALFDEGQ